MADYKKMLERVSSSNRTTPSPRNSEPTRRRSKRIGGGFGKRRPRSSFRNKRHSSKDTEQPTNGEPSTTATTTTASLITQNGNHDVDTAQKFVDIDDSNEVEHTSSLKLPSIKNVAATGTPADKSREKPADAKGPKRESKLPLLKLSSSKSRVRRLPSKKKSKNKLLNSLYDVAVEAMLTKKRDLSAAWKAKATYVGEDAVQSFYEMYRSGPSTNYGQVRVAVVVTFCCVCMTAKIADLLLTSCNHCNARN